MLVCIEICSSAFFLVVSVSGVARGITAAWLNAALNKKTFFFPI